MDLIKNMRVILALPFVFLSWLSHEVSDVIGGTPLEQFIKREFGDD